MASINLKKKVPLLEDVNSKSVVSVMSLSITVKHPICNANSLYVNKFIYYSNGLKM